jgi:hypothetical protein
MSAVAVRAETAAPIERLVQAAAGVIVGGITYAVGLFVR